MSRAPDTYRGHEPANLQLLRAFLKDSAEIRSLDDSGQVEHSFLEFEPDILLLDLHMPALDGPEILSRLSSTRSSLGSLPMIVLKADVTRIARHQGITQDGVKDQGVIHYHTRGTFYLVVDSDGSWTFTVTGSGWASGVGPAPHCSEG